MVGIFGILKAGGVYLPLDPAHPPERNAYMLDHSDARLLLSRKSLNRGLTSGCEVIDLCCYDAPNRRDTSHLNRPTASLDLAYVTYTSGSTGKPKGVLIQHNSVVNFIKAITDIIPINENDCLLSLTTITFDIFGLETFLPFSMGAKVVIGSQEQQLSTTAAAFALEERCITILQVTPSRLHLTLADAEAANSLRPLKYLLVGGEAFPGSLLENLRTLTKGKIYNLYGPTETTIWSTLKDVTGREALNIGKPLANTRIYILSASGFLQPVGVLGELNIAGAGLSRGYLNNVSLTAEKFAEFHINTFLKGERLYRTGDLARWLPDGNIEFLGRTDYQVKIRGFRIELGEIESQLQANENIKEAVVIPGESQSGDKYLCGYVVPRSSVPAESLKAAELRESLKKKLPDYMIPSYFVALEEMPLTPNGKIDRKALPADEGLRLGTGISYVSPETEVEKTIAQLWQEVLRREDKVGIEDNFFDLGGNSLRLIELNRKVNEVLKTHIPVMTMFRYPTIRALMENLNQETPPDAFTDQEIDESLSLMGENLKRLETTIEEET
jgi:amino acid adenylation domain-containing protein